MIHQLEKRRASFLLLLLTITHAGAFSVSPNTAAAAIGVRISLYPKTAEGQSLKQTIKNAVAGIADLGLRVQPDDCSTALLGPEPALFEATRAIFGRACRAPGEPHVSMICTFSAGGGDALRVVVDDDDVPERTHDDEWIADAQALPSRVAAQFAVYPLGKDDYMSTIDDVVEQAKQSPAFKHDIQTHFCSMLDGEGAEVFDVLRSSFALARERAGHVTMTVTLTANKSAWKN